ncbi:MAG: bifunctional riboflavin kinase/FAD synthetase [Oscillospiraceae bacterium]|nr:bifunctional riboflavin kinase/FAD synthetase [Oscillospiraceae bacterium]
MKRAVALGFFDGVHIGHGALLSKAKEIAGKEGLSPCVMTYSRHPSAVLSTKSVPLINTTEERAFLIRELYGITDIVIKDFTKEYSELSPVEFFEKILLEELSCAYVVAGFDFRFGKGGSGDKDTLLSLCKSHNIGCEIVPAVMCGGEPVSSTRIRAHLAAGEMDSSNSLLGHPHCILSPVIHGQALGEKLGFPTANQAFDDACQIPKFGVYISRVTVAGETFRAITNIGRRPTVCDGFSVYAETHIPGFSGDIYGEVMKTEFLRYLREEKKFSSRKELCEQISQDVLSAMQEI